MATLWENYYGLMQPIFHDRINELIRIFPRNKWLRMALEEKDLFETVLSLNINSSADTIPMVENPHFLYVALSYILRSGIDSKFLGSDSIENKNLLDINVKNNSIQIPTTNSTIREILWFLFKPVTHVGNYSQEWISWANINPIELTDLYVHENKGDFLKNQLLANNLLYIKSRMAYWDMQKILDDIPKDSNLVSIFPYVPKNTSINTLFSTFNCFWLVVANCIKEMYFELTQKKYSSPHIETYLNSMFVHMNQGQQKWDPQYMDMYLTIAITKVLWLLADEDKQRSFMISLPNILNELVKQVPWSIDSVNSTYGKWVKVLRFTNECKEVFIKLLDIWVFEVEYDINLLREHITSYKWRRDKNILTTVTEYRKFLDIYSFPEGDRTKNIDGYVHIHSYIFHHLLVKKSCPKQNMIYKIFN